MPLAGQLVAALREAMQVGRLHPNTRLPASRELAQHLGVSRSVVVDAYQQLIAEGYLVSRQGSGTTVGSGVTLRPSGGPVDLSPVRGPRFDMRPTVPDSLSFPHTDWLRSYREALGAASAQHFAEVRSPGVLELRAELVRYLGRIRAVATGADRVLIFNGFWQALDVLCRVLVARGVRTVVVEDPCFHYHRRIMRRNGLRPVSLPVDQDGLRVDLLEQTEADAVMVSPAHQFPTGAVMSARRRRALIQWAKGHDALIIEDDYDAEHRYDREPIGALQGLAPDNVIYGGTASKTLSPALRLGWLAVPSWLAEEVANEKAWADMGSPVLEQLALAHFLASGRLGRHLRRLRPIYRRRRDRLLTALADQLDEAHPRGAAAGLHVMLELPSGSDEAAVVARCAAAGLWCEGVAGHREAPGRSALVIGYGNLAEASIDAAVPLLVDAVKRERRRAPGRRS